MSRGHRRWVTIVGLGSLLAWNPWYTAEGRAAPGSQTKPPAEAKRTKKTTPATKRTPEVPAEPLVFPPHEPELWTNHFQAVEVTPGGRTVILSSDKNNIVDLRSKIILKRTSTTPRVIKVRTNERDKHFGIEVFVQYNDGGRGRACRYMIPIPGLSRVRAKQMDNVASCNPMPTTFNEDRDIAPGDTFEIDTSTLVHNDSVSIELRGQHLDERSSISTSKCVQADTATNGEKSVEDQKIRQVCPSATLPVKVHHEATFSILVKDFQTVVPYERINDADWVERVSRSRRFDIDNDLVVARSPPMPIAAGRTREGVQDGFHVEATARKGDEEPRTVSCPHMHYGPQCHAGSFADGERVTIIVSRPIVVDGQSVTEEVARYELEAAALGLHWAPAGNHRAYYSTASVLAVEWGNATDPRPTFAQTFAYSLYWKHRKHRWVEAFSGGAHLAVLGNTRDGENDAMAAMEADEGGLVSLGIGGQLGFGWDALQVGAGYDVLTQRPYLLIGIGVPDAVKLLDRLKAARQRP